MIRNYLEREMIQKAIGKGKREIKGDGELKK
jgi:hypothetical protein